MIRAHTYRMAALVAALSVGIAALGHELFYMPLLQSILAHRKGSLQDTSAEALDTELRAALPLGSSRNAVETLLPSWQISYNYTSPLQIEAMARNLKESSRSGRTALWLRFDFDDHDVLRSIHSHIIRTPASK